MEVARWERTSYYLTRLMEPSQRVACYNLVLRETVRGQGINIQFIPSSEIGEVKLAIDIIFDSH